jgi:hypothetical protein
MMYPKFYQICERKFPSAGVMDKCTTPAWFVMWIWCPARSPSEYIKVVWPSRRAHAAVLVCVFEKERWHKSVGPSRLPLRRFQLSRLENLSPRVVLDNLKRKDLRTSATRAQRTSQLFEGNVGPDPLEGLGTDGMIGAALPWG